MGVNNLRPFAPLSFKHTRPFPQQQDDEPNTPSKSKMLPRRSYSVYATLLLVAVVTVLLFVQHDVEPSRSDSYYRKALVSKMYASPDSKSQAAAGFEDGTGSVHLPRTIPNSEARQREALEIADRIMTLHSGSPSEKQQGALSAGGGSVPSLILIEDELPAAGTQTSNDDAQADGAAQTTGAQTDGSATPAEGDLATVLTSGDAAATTTAPSTVFISQIFTSGETRELVVDAARMAFLDVMSDGLESEDVESTGPEHLDWWTIVINAAGDLAAQVVRPSTGPQAALATSQSLDAEEANAPENHDDEDCKIAVLDVGGELGPSLGARPCDLSFKRVWPFSRHKAGIDGVETLLPEDYQYAAEHWISEAIRNSSRYIADPEAADFVFIDMWCYHTAWLAYIHPLGNRNTSNPEPYMRRTLNAIVKMDKFTSTKGGAFALAHPSPIMRGLFSEEAMCEDLASVLHLVPERSSLCVWTQDSPMLGKSVIIPYAATLDLDFEADLATVQRDLFIFFRGGCGHPDPSIRGLFAAGKMLRYDLVETLYDMGDDDVEAECSCDICDNHMPHPQVLANYRRTQFCPIVPSNAQSSRRLSEVILAGCIPVFLGPPFHTLPLATDIDYGAMSVFFNITAATWFNESSANHLQNHMAQRVWRLDDPSLEPQVINVESLKDAVAYLRGISAVEIASKRAAVLRQRFKFFYGPVPESSGGDGHTSELGELLMKKMCRRAATIKRRMSKAKEQGMDVADSDVQIRHASLSHSDRQQHYSVWSLFKSHN